MRRLPEKHITFFALIEAMARPGCFLCRLEQVAIVRGLDSVLHESVNDPGLRTRLRRGGGFCHEHGHLLAGMGDAMGVSILMRDQLAAAAHLKGSAKARGAVGRSPDCPSCQVRRETAARHIATLDEFADDPELQSAVTELRALCLPHFHTACRRLRSERVRVLLRETLAAQITALSQDLAEYIRDQSDRSRGERDTEMQGPSWRDAISLLHGWRFPLEELRRRR